MKKMIRPIKFRAWDKKRKYLLPVHELEWHKISHSLTKCVGYDDWDSDGYTMRGGGNMMYANGDRYILMQYTGFKDRNGKEIYEGDLVTSPILLPTYDTQPIGEICFGDGSWLVNWPKHQSYLSARVGTLEVIGNRWGNPDLLGVVE